VIYIHSSCRFSEPDPVFAEVENRMISTHEDISKNPKRTAWWRYVERHEPADADGLPSLLQFHDVLHIANVRKFNNDVMTMDSKEFEVKFASQCRKN
jgi:predicted nucleic acid-binding protein